MGTAHYFSTDHIAAFRRSLRAQHYSCEEVNGWTVCSKMLSAALIKHYSFWAKPGHGARTILRVTYELVHEGKPLHRLADQLKRMNRQYLLSLPGWKTKSPPSDALRDIRSNSVHAFLKDHQELIGCFRYQPGDSVFEGNHSFNAEVASTPKELVICFQFIKGLLGAYSPHGLVRGRRQIDRPSLQRNGWIRRYAGSCRKRGWTTIDIASEIQKELREGTWNERSRLQYNLAGGTICKIAGMKIRPRSFN